MNNSKRNYQKPPIAKLELWILEPQSLVFSSCTSDFKLESFSESLHLNPPSLTFCLLQKPNWYSGIPITMVLLATNLRFQPINDATLEVSVTSNNRVIFTTQSPTVYPSINAQHSVTFPFRFTPPTITDSLKVTAKINFTFDSQLTTNSMQINMQIFPSIKYDVSAANYSSTGTNSSFNSCANVNFIGFEIENLFPFPISELCVIAGNEKNNKKIVSEKLLRNEKIFGFVRKSTTFEIKFSLPFAKDCAVLCPLKPKVKSTKKKPVTIRFLNDRHLWKNQIHSKSMSNLNIITPSNEANFKANAIVNNNIQNLMCSTKSTKSNDNLLRNETHFDENVGINQKHKQDENESNKETESKNANESKSGNVSKIESEVKTENESNMMTKSPMTKGPSKSKSTAVIFKSSEENNEEEEEFEFAQTVKENNDLKNKPILESIDEDKTPKNPKIIAIMTPFQKTLRIANKTSKSVRGAFQLKSVENPNKSSSNTSNTSSSFGSLYNLQSPSNSSNALEAVIPGTLNRRRRLSSRLLEETRGKNRNENEVIIFGKPVIEFELGPLEKKSVDVIFIALKEGLIKFPNIIIEVEVDGKLERNEISCDSGIIAIGRA